MKRLEEYTLDEIIAKFKALYNQALEHYNKEKEGDNVDSDDEHYMYEAVMELLGKEVWDELRAFRS